MKLNAIDVFLNSNIANSITLNVKIGEGKHSLITVLI